MAHIILVHGLGATDKSWFDIPQALRDAGHDVDPILLPDQLLATMADYVEAITAALPASGSCVLIGHSMGGVSISQVAADHPDKVSKLIYVTALVPEDRESAGAIIGGLSTSFEAIGTEFERLGIGPDHPSRRWPRLGALVGRFRTSPGFAQIPKHYIRCAHDTIVKPTEQAEMIAKWHFESAPELPSGHIPQREIPDRLAPLLLDLIE